VDLLEVMNEIEALGSERTKKLYVRLNGLVECRYLWVRKLAGYPTHMRVSKVKRTREDWALNVRMSDAR